MRTGTMTLPQAIRAAGATQIALRPDGHTPPNSDPILRHCHQPMTETLDRDTRQPVRYHCTTCGTSITHIDGHGTPASITPKQRATLQATGEAWTIETTPETILTNRGAAGTATI